MYLPDDLIATVDRIHHAREAHDGNGDKTKKNDVYIELLRLGTLHIDPETGLPRQPAAEPSIMNLPLFFD